MSAPRLTDAARMAIIDDYVARVPLKLISKWHGVHIGYPQTLAKRRGVRRGKRRGM